MQVSLILAKGSGCRLPSRRLPAVSKEHTVISHLVILVTVLLSLGAGPAEAGRKAPTLSELTQAVAQNPQDPQARYSLGLKYESLGKTKKAIEEYQKALNLKPDDEKALYSLGRLMGELGESEQAIKLIQKALKLKPDFAQARSLLAAIYGKQGVALMEQGSLEAAKEALEAGIQANAGAAETKALRNNLECLYVRENRLDQAIGTFQEVLQQNPNVAQALQPGPPLLRPGGLPGGLPADVRLEGPQPRPGGRAGGLPLQDRTSTDWTPPVKTMLTFPGSPLLTQGRHTVGLPVGSRTEQILGGPRRRGAACSSDLKDTVTPPSACADFPGQIRAIPV